MSTPIGNEHLHTLATTEAVIAAGVEAQDNHATILAAVTALNLPLDVANQVVATIPADVET